MRLEGLEPPTGCLEGSCSVLLSYRRTVQLCRAKVTRAQQRGRARSHLSARSPPWRRFPIVLAVTATVAGSRAPARRVRPGTRVPGWPAAAGILAGAAADALLGDPRRGHPVALFGRAAQAAQERVYADSRLRGAGYAAGCVLAAAAPALVAQRLTRGRPWLRLAATAAAAWTVTGARSLTIEAERYRRPRGRRPDCGPGHSAEPVRAGSRLARREGAGPGRGGVGRREHQRRGRRAAGVGGARRAARAGRLPGGQHAGRDGRVPVGDLGQVRLGGARGWTTWQLGARAADRAAGRGAGAGRRRDARATWRAMRRYGARHPSPNAGRCEAAFAGALGVRLGGTNVYAGAAERRPALGRGARRGRGHPPRGAPVPRGYDRCDGCGGCSAVAAAARTRRSECGHEGRASGGGHDLGRGQERAHRRAVPLAGPAGRAGRPVQGAEHVAELVRHRRRRGDRPGPGHAGRGGGHRARRADEPGAAQAGQRPAQPGGGARAARKARSTRSSTGSTPPGCWTWPPTAWPSCGASTTW